MFGAGRQNCPWLGTIILGHIRLTFRDEVLFLGDEHSNWGQNSLGHYLLHSWLILVVQRPSFYVLRNQPTPNLWYILPRV